MCLSLQQRRHNDVVMQPICWSFVPTTAREYGNVAPSVAYNQPTKQLHYYRLHMPDALKAAGSQQVQWRHYRVGDTRGGN